MQLTVGVVDDFKAYGPKQGKFGEYFSHEYVVGGEKFSKMTKSADPIAPIGSEVKILFNQNTTEKGTFNNIEKLEVVSSASAETAINRLKKFAKVSVTQGLTAKDLSIARMNAVTSAVNLVPEGAGLETALKVAEEIVKYTTEPYLNPKVLENKANDSENDTK